MLVLTRVFCDVRRIIEMPEDHISFYFELLRCKDDISNRILLIFDNNIALEQCYYRSISLAKEKIKTEKEIILNINDTEYEFITIDKIYKTNRLLGRKYKDILFKDAYERIF